MIASIPPRSLGVISSASGMYAHGWNRNLPQSEGTLSVLALERRRKGTRARPQAMEAMRAQVSLLVRVKKYRDGYSTAGGLPPMRHRERIS